MNDVNDYTEEKSCTYKNEEYLVRDNGAVLRKTPSGKKKRKLDDVWTFGKANEKTGYVEIASVRIHRIVATAFLGEPPTKEHIVDHIDTNRQNNRPSNLRWITRLENAVLNPVTRKRIEYCTGVDIFAFLECPSKYRDCFENPDFSWMRRVSEEEAKACLENVRKWSEESPKERSKRSEKGKLGEWIYNKTQTSESRANNPNFDRQSSIPKPYIIESLSPLAKQKDWKTPTKFLCCPEKIDSNPIKSYFNNLSEGAAFTENQYGESTIEKYALVKNDAIVIITSIPSSIKPLALVKITFEDGYYLHTSLGTFFSEDGAEKQYTLAQGLEWTGGDSIDDYC